MPERTEAALALLNSSASALLSATSAPPPGIVRAELDNGADGGVSGLLDAIRQEEDVDAIWAVRVRSASSTRPPPRAPCRS